MNDIRNALKTMSGFDLRNPSNAANTFFDTLLRWQENIVPCQLFGWHTHRDNTLLAQL
jgi:hypothetical protein